MASATSHWTAGLAHLPDIERLSSRVIRILGGNPSKFTLQGTNTYLIGQGPKRLLIDTGQGMPEWVQSLKNVLSDEKASIDKVILTHWHPDHVGGIQDLLQFSPKTSIFKNQPSEGQSEIKDGQVFATAGATLRAFHCPGHTVDHMALILEEEDAMFTGDNILGQGTAVFEDLAAYINSLEKMQQQFSGRAYPAHGPVIEEGKSRIQYYINHRKEREEQIVKVLNQKQADGSQDWKSMEIVKEVYQHVPENLHIPAEGGVKHVLKKLEIEGKVTYHADSDAWTLKSQAAL